MLLSPVAGLTLWLTGCMGLVLPVFGEAPGFVYRGHGLAALLDTADVPESSGVIASRKTTDIYWTHNDSGSAVVRVWAFRLSADDISRGIAPNMGYVQLAGVANIDSEDIAAGPNATIYILDGGDNPPCERTDKCIYRFAEPVIDPAGSPINLTISPDVLAFEYPDSQNPSQPADSDDERYDAECLFVHPPTGDVYIVTKRDSSDVGKARVYKLSASSITWNRGNLHVLKFVADITSTIEVAQNVVTTVTGGDIDVAGRRVLIRRYPTAYEFALPDGEPFDSIFAQMPARIMLFGELQGEGICYTTNQDDIMTTSEVLVVYGKPVGPTTCPIFITKRQPASRPTTSPATSRAE